MLALPVRGCHPLRPVFPECSVCPAFAPGLVRVRSPLLTESLLLSFPPGTEMFQFPGWALHAYGFSVQSFRDLGLNARLTAPPRLSQSSTPFIASWRPDIPHTPLVAWPHWPRPPTLACARLDGQDRQTTPELA